jgi:hypothetical protein
MSNPPRTSSTLAQACRGVGRGNLLDKIKFLQAQYNELWPPPGDLIGAVVRIPRGSIFDHPESHFFDKPRPVSDPILQKRAAISREWNDVRSDLLRELRPLMSSGSNRCWARRGRADAPWEDFDLWEIVVAMDVETIPSRLVLMVPPNQTIEQWFDIRVQPISQVAAKVAPTSSSELEGEELTNAIKGALRLAIANQTAEGGKALNGKEQVAEAMKILAAQDVRSRHGGLKARVQEIADQPEFLKCRRRVGLRVR